MKYEIIIEYEDKEPESREFDYYIQAMRAFQNATKWPGNNVINIILWDTEESNVVQSLRFNKYSLHYGCVDWEEFEYFQTMKEAKEQFEKYKANPPALGLHGSNYIELQNIRTGECYELCDLLSSVRS